MIRPARLSGLVALGLTLVSAGVDAGAPFGGPGQVELSQITEALPRPWIMMSPPGEQPRPCVTVSQMDLHRLAEERSIAYHRVISERLESQPEILERARRRVEGWLVERSSAPFYARKWAEILNGDVPSIASFLVDRSELAIELRQSTPFAGALRPQERWKIWRETRERFDYDSRTA